jgi:hypothetical protein
MKTYTNSDSDAANLFNLEFMKVILSPKHAVFAYKLNFVGGRGIGDRPALRACGSSFFLTQDLAVVGQRCPRKAVRMPNMPPPQRRPSPQINSRRKSKKFPWDMLS